MGDVMKRIAGWPLLLCGLGFGSTAYSQTACPQGVGPGSAQCGPGPGAMSAPPAPAPPRARWILTWGALAQGEDAEGGIVGTSTGQRSRRAAKRAAVARCEQMGGMGCKSIIEYKHQCVAAAEPIERGLDTPFFFRAPTVEAAESNALSGCPAHNNGRVCKIQYSNCTQPYLVYD